MLQRVLLILGFFSAKICAQNYDAYGNNLQDDEAYGTKTEKKFIRVPEVPIKPSRFNIEDVDLINEMAKPVNNLPKSVVIGAMPAIDIALLTQSAPTFERPSTPPTRRIAESQGHYTFEKAKWSVEPESAIAQAVMFDRTTGLNCNECLSKCANDFQNSSMPWICRSVTYDHTWKICDLFAINGAEYPFFLVEFKGRDYFSYLAALPPTNKNLSENVSHFEVQNKRPLTKQKEHKISTTQTVEVEQELDSSTATVIPPALTGGNLAPKQWLPFPIVQPTINVTPPPSLSVPAPVKTILETQLTAEKSAAPPSSSQYNSVAENTNAKSYAVKTQQINKINSFSQKKEESKKLLQKSIKIQAIEQNFSAPAKAEKKTDFSEIDSIFDFLNFESESSTIQPKSQNSFLVTSNFINKKLKIENVVQTTTLNSPTHSGWNILRSSVNIIPIVKEEEEEEDFKESSFIQEKQKKNLSKSSSSTSSSSSFKTITNNTYSDLRPTAIATSGQETNDTVNVNRKLHKAQGITSLSADPNNASLNIALNNCGPDKQSRFILFDGFKRSNNKINIKHFFTAKTMEECVKACDSQRFFTCTSVVFSFISGCQLFSTSVNHSDESDLIPTFKSQYIEKSCIPVKYAQGILKISHAVPKFILVGHVQEVTNAKTFTDCQISCLRSELEFGFLCQSAMWYPQDSDQESFVNCLLNAESRQSKPEVFVTEDPGVVMLYFEMLPIKPYSNSIQQLTRFWDLPLQTKNDKSSFLKSSTKSNSESKWTRWSSCKTKDLDNKSIRIRYKKCSQQKDIRKCSKETVFCENAKMNLRIQKIATKPNIEDQTTTSTTNSLEVSETSALGKCYAIRNLLGKKHCPYGMRLVNGRREFCRTPVDCS